MFYLWSVEIQIDTVVILAAVTIYKHTSSISFSSFCSWLFSCSRSFFCFISRSSGCRFSSFSSSFSSWSWWTRNCLFSFNHSCWCCFCFSFSSSCFLTDLDSSNRLCWRIGSLSRSLGLCCDCSHLFRFLCSSLRSNLLDNLLLSIGHVDVCCMLGRCRLV